MARVCILDESRPCRENAHCLDCSATKAARMVGILATSSVGAGRTSHEHRDEESALQLLPAAREIRDFVEARIPPGTGWGVFLLPGEDDKDGLRRVLALTSNRDVMARAVGTWLMDVLGPGTYRKEIVVEPDGRRGAMRVPIAETKPGA